MDPLWPGVEDQDFAQTAYVRPKSSYPIVALQGTDNLEGILDDANPLGIGIVQYLSNVGQVFEDLTISMIPGIEDESMAPVSFTGNSLGASLAQQFSLTVLDPVGLKAGIEENVIKTTLENLEDTLSEYRSMSLDQDQVLGLLGLGANAAIFNDLFFTGGLPRFEDHNGSRFLAPFFAGDTDNSSLFDL